MHYVGALELGGSQSFVMELYRNIDRTKVQFDFVIFEGWRGPLFDEIQELGGRIYDSPKYNGINHIRFISWWNRFFDSHPEYHVLHGHVRSVASIYLPIAKKHRVFTVLHSHSASNGDGCKSIAKALLQLPVRHIADYYMACSDDAGRWLFGEQVIHSKKYSTIPNAINIKRFEYDIDVRDRMRKALGLEESLVIGHIGRFYDVKNHVFLLHVLSEVIRARKDVKLIFVGDGPLKSEIEDKCKEMHLLDYVVFTGNRIDTENFYQAMDIFVFPSKWEGLGIAAIEAQASGLPCVISEGVPKSVDVGAGLVKRVSLDLGVKSWANAVINTDTSNRQSRLSEVKASGFDVKDNAYKMQMFYLKVDRMVIQKW